MTTLIGNLLLWTVGRFSLPYPAFLVGMLVAGAGAGLLNSETTKVMQGAVPAQRAGMASGLTATTGFVGLLVGIAALGAVLAQVASRSFTARGVAAGLDAETAAELAKHVTSGDVADIIGTVPEALRASVWQIGNAAFADGFAAAALLAAAVAAAMALFTVLLVRRAETLPVTLAEGESLSQKESHSRRRRIDSCRPVFAPSQKVRSTTARRPRSEHSSSASRHSRQWRSQHDITTLSSLRKAA